MSRPWSRLAPVTLVGLLAAATPARAPAQEPALVAIRAGRLVDVERGEVRRDQVVLVRGDRITAVQPASVRIPAGARIIDLSRSSGVILSGAKDRAGGESEPGRLEPHSHARPDPSLRSG